MTTLITGAGLIGTAFARCALDRGEDVVFFDPEPRAAFLARKLKAEVPLIRGDVRDLPALIAALREHRCETVVHSAGLIGGRVDQALYTGFQINIQGTINVAEAVRLSGVRRLVHVSTFGVYDLRRPAIPPLMAEDFPRGQGRGYGNSKVAKELILEAYHNRYGFELVIVRPANVIGNGHFWSGSGGGEKVHELLRAGFEGRTARIPSDQTAANEYVYAKDIGRILDAAATREAPDQIAFNAGSGVVSSFDDLLAAVRAVYPGLDVEVIGKAPAKDRPTALDLSASKSKLGWMPAYDLPSAIADYAAEFEDIGPF